MRVLRRLTKGETILKENSLPGHIGIVAGFHSSCSSQIAVGGPKRFWFGPQEYVITSRAI